MFDHTAINSETKFSNDCIETRDSNLSWGHSYRHCLSLLVKFSLVFVHSSNYNQCISFSFLDTIDILDILKAKTHIIRPSQWLFITAFWGFFFHILVLILECSSCIVVLMFSSEKFHISFI